MSLPNILYLHSHDTGRAVQPYGYPSPTPHFQRLAEQGVLFRQAFCAAPTCSPSRAALLTGQCAHSSGMLGLAHRGFSLHDYGQHLVHTLRRAGYTSTLIGMQHLAPDPRRLGYDQVAPVASAAAAHVAPAAAAFLHRAPTQPFFLDVGFEETHRPFHPLGPDDDPRYSPAPPGLPDTPATRADMAGFLASARRLDAGVGVVLDALDAAGLADNTLVVCTTDHGVAFPGAKCTLTDRGIGVLLILRGPAGWERGRVSDALVSHVDIFPTLCDVVGVGRPGWLQGRSLLPLLAGETDAVNTEIFAEVTYHAAYEPQRAVRTTRWKYIRRFGERQTPVLPNMDDSPSKEVWLSHGWHERVLAQEELYDLVFDPAEAHNLAASDAARPVLKELRGRLARWMQATDDPLLRGPVPAPSGAEVNDPDGLSPSEPTRVID